ncbi:hypothetical protein [Bacillus cereus]|nr:hypothetical protein [Bacillus cereus]
MTFSEWHVREYGETVLDSYAFYIRVAGKEDADLIMEMRKDRYKKEN